MRCRCEHNEDEAAVLLLLLVERLPSDWYLNQLKGGRVECDALLLLFRARHPQLFSVDVISSAGVTSPLHLALSVAGAAWLLSLWVGVLPLDCLALAWHLLLSEDTPDAVPPPSNLRIGLALLQRCEAGLAASLAACDDDDNDDPEASTYGVVMRAADGISPRELQALLREAPLAPAEAVAHRVEARQRLAEEEVDREHAREARRAAARAAEAASASTSASAAAPPRRRAPRRAPHRASAAAARLRRLPCCRSRRAAAACVGVVACALSPLVLLAVLEDVRPGYTLLLLLGLAAAAAALRRYWWPRLWVRVRRARRAWRTSLAGAEVVSAASLPSHMSIFLDTYVGDQLPPSTSMQEVRAAATALPSPGLARVASSTDDAGPSTPTATGARGGAVWEPVLMSSPLDTDRGALSPEFRGL